MRSRRSMWIWALVLLAAIAITVLVLRREREASMGAIDPSDVTARAEVRDDAALVEAPTDERAVVVPTGPAVAPPHPLPPPRVDTHTVSGIVRFLDGTTPDPFRIVFEHASNAPTRDEPCPRKASAVTDTDGRFEVGRLCARPHRARVSGFAGNNESFRGLVDVPSRDVELVFPGRVLHAEVVDAAGTPVAGAMVRARAILDAPQTSSTMTITQPTSRDGRVSFVLADAARFTVDAFREALVAEPREVDLSVSSSARVRLALAPAVGNPATRIAVTSCGTHGEPIRDWCLTFGEASTGQRMFRVCSKDVRADGTTDVVRSGTYRVHAVPRFLGDAALYHDQSKEPGATIVVEDGRVNEVAVCVRLGGRIALVVRERDPGDEPSKGPVSTFLVDERDGKTRPLTLREPDATGAAFANSLPFDVERASGDVLEAGEHVVRVRAPGFEDEERRVFRQFNGPRRNSSKSAGAILPAFLRSTFSVFGSTMT